MVFIITYPANGQVINLPVAVQVQTQQGLKYFNVKDLLTNPQLLVQLKAFGINLGVDLLYNTTKPVIVLNGNNKLSNVNQVYKQSAAMNFKVPNDEQLRAIFKQKVTDAQLEMMKALFEAVAVFKQIISEPIKFKIEVPNSVILNSDAIKEIKSINESQTELEFIKKGLNENLFMKTPEDPEFIKLLTYGEIVGETVERPFPSPNSIYNPYRDNKFRRPSYKNELLVTDDVKLIEGNSDNNDLDIQPNEQNFYDAMCELMDYGILQEHPNVTIEDARKDGVSSKYVRDYLTALAVEVCKWNWSHTGLLEFDVDFESDDDNDSLDFSDDVDESDETLGNFSFILTDQSSKPGSGSFVLSAYIEKASEHNIYAACEAVIKLLRWGDRKPTRLKLKGIDKYLVLKDFKVSESSGSIANLEIKKDGTYQYMPEKIVMAYGNFEDSDYLKDIQIKDDTLNVPVGLLCRQSFTTGESREVYFSLIDVVNNIESGKNEIYNISKSADGSIKVDQQFTEDEKISLQDVIIKVNSDVSSKVVYYTPEGIRDLYLKYQENVSKASYLAILAQYLHMSDVTTELDTFSFEDKQDLLYKVKETGYATKSYLEANIAKAILPVVLNVANECEAKRDTTGEPTLGDVLTLYAIQLLKRDIIEIMNPSDSRGTSANRMDALAAKMTKMSGFDSTPAKKEEQVKETNAMQNKVRGDEGNKAVEDLFTPLKAIPKENDMVFPIVFKDTKTVDAKPEKVGYVCISVIDGKKKYILLREEDNNKPAGNKTLNLMQLVKAMASDYYNVVTGNVNASILRFPNIEAFKYYADLLKKRI